MERILELLKNAIKKIDIRYYDNDRKERGFAYELYHQMRLQNLPKEVEVTCESGKKRFNEDDDIFKDKLVKKYFFDPNRDIPSKIYRYPDLLVHQFETRDHQLLAIEIKKRFVDDKAILTDLVKLIVYCNGRLKYKKGILILINPTRNIKEVHIIKELLKNYPEIEIWIAKPNLPIEIICSETLKNYN